MQNKVTAKILDGKAVASDVREKIKSKVDEFVSKSHRAPGLAVVLIGDNPASQIYVKNKIQACKKAGIESFHHLFPADVKIDEVMKCIHELNESEVVDGILIQLPLPKHLPTDEILMAVKPDKDADGLHPFNLGMLMSGKSGLRPCTPQGVMVLLEHYGIEFSGKHAVVLGRSNLVGKPVSLMLMEKNATVTICHSKSRNLEEIVRSADILVVAAGKAGLVPGSWVKKDSVVVDVGIHRLDNESGQSEIVGDVAFAQAAAVASYITPVPGGVGPMTIAMLLQNTLTAYQMHMGWA